MFFCHFLNGKIHKILIQFEKKTTHMYEMYCMWQNANGKVLSGDWSPVNTLPFAFCELFTWLLFVIEDSKQW